MKIFKKFGLFLFGMAGVLGLASCGAKQESVDSSRSLMNYTERTTPTYTDADIANFIKGKTNPGQRYYKYDLLVNRASNWEVDGYNTNYVLDEMGYPFGENGDFPETLTFEKGKMYVVSGYYYRNATTEGGNDFPNGLTKEYYCPDDILLDCYNFDSIDTGILTEYGLDHDEDGYSYYEMTCDPWEDGEPCIECVIDGNYQQAYRNYVKLNNDYFNKCQLYITPTQTFSVKLESVGNYPSAELCIYSADLRALELDTTAPSIEGENIYINVDNPLSFEQIKSHFSAHDETDGDITDRLSFTDNTYILTNGKIACGTYSFKVSVSDKAGNTTTKLYYAHVVDYTDPTIKGSTINVSYTKLLSSTEIKNLFTYSDNYTPNNQLLFRIIEDKYTSTYQNLGAHTITAKIIDQQGNEATAVSTVNVIDDKAPFMVLPENLKITTLDNLSLDDFRQYVTVTDEKEGNITNFELTDLDGYLNDTKKAGTFRIKVVASDSASNSIENTFPFLVEDKDMPSITIDPDYIMVVNKGDSITKEQVINYFIRTGQLTLEEAETIEVASIYFDVEPQAGFYTLRLSNEYKVIESKIKVLDDGSTEEPVNPDKPLIPEDNKFFSTEGYVDNFLKPASWSIYHYLTILGALVVVLVVVIVIIIKKK